MHISSRNVIKALGSATAALVCVLTLTSCSSGDSEGKAANLCGIASSEEEALVREILVTEGYETKAYKSTSELVDKMEAALQHMRPGKDSYFNTACRYEDDRPHRGYAIFSFGWSPRAASEVSPSHNGASYELNGAGGVASAGQSTLLVQCDLPGELGGPSRNVRLSADAMFDRPDGPVVDQAAKDRRMTLTYLMARRVTDALGCENKPLAAPPVVKPLPTP